MTGPPNQPGAEPHTPVLYQQVLSALQPSAGSRYIDGTVGAGGHAAGILQLSKPDGQLLGIDRDPNALELAQTHLARFSERVHLRRGSYAEMVSMATSLGWDSVSGVLLDLGLSSMQLADSERGFSFQKAGPLDMRFDPEQSLRAEDLVNGLSELELTELIKSYGEEPRARRIARAIIRSRPLSTTIELAEAVRGALGAARGRIDPATRTFQALRIAVNDELAMLSEGLIAAVSLLEAGGRLAVISFHSLEDRMVKHFLRQESQDCICPPEQQVCTCEHHARLKVLTKRPIRPEETEIQENPRARSAKLRIAERIQLA